MFPNPFSDAPPLLRPHVDDHALLIAVVSEHLHTEAEALLAAGGDVHALLRAGGVCALSRIAWEEAQRLERTLLAIPPRSGSGAPSVRAEE